MSNVRRKVEAVHPSSFILPNKESYHAENEPR
jgi:hypothetical protein